MPSEPPPLLPYRADPQPASSPTPRPPRDHIAAAIREIDRIYAEWKANRDAMRRPPRVY